jgi:hypothetical protein
MAETKKLYGVFGITSEMWNAWKGQLRDDLMVWFENNEIEARLKLTREEAKLAKQQIKEFNSNGAYNLQLKRVY